MRPSKGDELWRSLSHPANVQSSLSVERRRSSSAAALALRLILGQLLRAPIDRRGRSVNSCEQKPGKFVVQVRRHFPNSVTWFFARAVSFITIRSRAHVTQPSPLDKDSVPANQACQRFFGSLCSVSSLLADNWGKPLIANPTPCQL